MNKYHDIIYKLAKKAYLNGDVPIGAIIVENNKIIAKAYNKKEKTHDLTAHAEMIAIKKACKKKKSSYLNDCILYTSLEPCMMCTGAIIQSHIKQIIYFAESPKYGYLTKINNKIKNTLDIDEKTIKLLKAFFANKR